MATEEQRRLPIFDYHVISDGGPKEPKPGDQWEEPVYEEQPPPGSKKKGDKQIGTVEIHAKGPADAPRFDAFFTFTDPPCSITVRGDVPGRDNWQGKGKANAEGEGRQKEIDIEFWNPKRW
jgi:hypothetical protein